MNVIIDLEHTISNAWHRIDKKNTNGFIRGEFQPEFANDRPNNNVIIFMKQLKSTGSEVIILSNKIEVYRPTVVNWLLLHGVYYSKLILRPDTLSINISAQEFKNTIIKGCSKKIDFVLDDVGKNCASIYEENNIPCLRIEQR